MRRLVLAAAAALVLATGSAPAAGSAFAAPTPHIIGDTQAPPTPWEVQLVFGQGGGTYGCTGEQLNSSWILTANHCIDGDQWMDAYHSNSTTNPGSPVPVDGVYSAPAGDIGLAHLASPYGISSFPSLDLGYGAQNSGSGTIMGTAIGPTRSRPTACTRRASA